MNQEVQAAEVVSAVGESVAQETKALLHVDGVKSYLAAANIMRIAVSVVTVILFYIVYRVIKRLIMRAAQAKMKEPNARLLGKVLSYVFFVLLVMYVLGLFGINLSAVWGAAGVAGVAIGFAAQTSASNLISGLFIVGEKSLKVGDFVSVDGISGTVDTVGPLSVALKTPENQVVRVPNSTILGKNLTNFSKLPIRRLTIEIPISYEADLKKALAVIATVPDQCPHVLKDPAPLLFYDGFGAAISLKLCLWMAKGDLIPVKNEAYVAIVETCAREGVVIPYTRYDIHIVSDDEQATALA